MKFVIISRFNRLSGGEIQSLELYELLRSVGEDVSVFSTDGGAVKARRFDGDFKVAKNTFFLVFCYHPAIAKINHRENKIIYFAVNTVVTQKEMNIVALCDIIIVNSYHSASYIAGYVSGRKIPICRLPCYVASSRFDKKVHQNRGCIKIGRHSRGISTKFSSIYRDLRIKDAEFSFLGIEESSYIDAVGSPMLGARFYAFDQLDVPKYLSSLDIFLYLLGSFRESWCRSVCEAMFSGLPVIVQNRDAFREYIYDGFTGLFADSVSQVISIVGQLRDSDLRNHIGTNAHGLMSSIMEPTKWVTDLKMICRGEFPVLNNYIMAENVQRWIFAEAMRIESNSFRIIRKFDGTDLLSGAIEFLSRILFDDSYIFLKEMPRIDAFRLYPIIKRLGMRGMKFHLCIDFDIADEFKPLFSNISIISVEEGVKQIRSKSIM